jgi:hypothetical protein
MYPCTFIAFSLKTLAILPPPCFYEHSNTSTEEVRMKIYSMKRQIPMLCATTAAVGSRALLG